MKGYGLILVIVKLVLFMLEIKMRINIILISGILFNIIFKFVIAFIVILSNIHFYSNKLFLKLIYRLKIEA